MLGLTPVVAHGQLSDRPPRADISKQWYELDGLTREFLQSHAKRWNKYPPRKRLNLLRQTRRFENMPAQKRKRILRRMRQFEALSPQQKTGLCNQFLNERGYLPPPCRL